MNEKKRIGESTRLTEIASNAAQVYATVYDLVNKTYLNRIENMEIVPLDDSDIESRSSINFRLVEITRIVYDNRKSAIENLLNVLGTLHPDYTVAMIIQAKDAATHFYLGIRSSSQAKPASSGIKLLKQALEGSFPGSDHNALKDDEINSILNTADINKSNPQWAIGSTSFIPSLKHEDYDQFTQGLERFIDAMHGKDYTAMILAEPVNHEQLTSLQTGYESMATSLSMYQKTSLSVGSNESQAVSESITKGVTETLSKSVTMSQSYTEGASISKSDTHGKSTNRASAAAGTGALLGAAVGSFIPIIGTISGSIIGGAIGGIIGGSRGEKNESHTESLSSNKSNTSGESNQTGHSKSDSLSDTKGSTSSLGKSETIGLEQQNKGVERLIAKIDQQLKRFDSSRSYGVWNASFYVLSENTESAHTACALFKGVLKGNESTIEDSAITIWNQRSAKNNRIRSLEYFQNVVHPRLIMGDSDSASSVKITPSSLVSGKELALLMNFPRRSVSGISVLDMPEFGRDVVYQSDKPDQEDTFMLGRVYHYGNVMENSEIRLSLNSLKMHTFVTGSTGSGKTNTVCKLIRAVRDRGVRFLIIEPSKGEYKNFFGGYTDVHVFGTNPSYAPLLRLNPFEFPENVHVLEHVDRLVEIFNACWPMYAAMPAILKSGIEEAYKLCGWDLEYSRCITDNVSFPTISDLSETLPIIIQNSLYSDELKSNYSGALLTRVSSLNGGLTGLIFDDSSISDEILFDSNCIIDLSRIGSPETKALLMGIVFLKLHEYRQSQNVFYPDLKHITVLEEAHQLLRKTSQEQSQESSNLQGKSVEMISNAIAEMRAYGEGFIIADQAPGLLDQAVIRNTNTKIILKLPEENDRKITGNSAFMTEKQINEIPRFPTGVAAVYQNNWMMPVLCKVDLIDEMQPFTYEYNNEANFLYSKKMTSRLLNVLLSELDNGTKERIKASVESYSESEYRDLIDYIKSNRWRQKREIISVLEDIKKGVPNVILEESNSYRLSKLLSNVMDYKAILREVRIKADVSDYHNWTQSMVKLLDTKFDIHGEDKKMALIGLILEQEKVASEHGAEFYESWNTYLRDKLLGNVRTI